MNATLLPEGVPLAGVVDERGVWTSEGLGDHDALPGRFVLPGLVDAHGHLSVGVGEDGSPRALSMEETRRNLARARESGITAIRDTGGPGGVTLRLLHDRQGDGGALLVSGRFLAPSGQYFPALYEPVEATDLVAAARAEIAAGARWVKLVADFPMMREGAPPPADAVPSYSIADVRDLVQAVHEAGARVAAHTTTTLAGELVAAGVDSIEHGNRLTESDVLELAARGGAWTPTLCALLLPWPGEDEGRRERRARLRERFSHLLGVAVERDLTILTGTDVVGDIATEVRLLTELGVPPRRALEAASGAALRYLDVTGLAEGRPANLISYHEDPREDPETLARPAAVIAQGSRIL
ncbi:amidohydrolase [Sphaerisporangium krabiense]|uniref:Imidazolonepropionase-like amidohydrolase n=1 Tax=Sphaerisporangium krabiense TaxID=763782 RepID=A0A7W8Z8X0_9ACTN|nr:amidohydrolase family protein [Sphaerisporangium krabiense]MBB5629641.1 imidazolonepropionase-like amidohydrolase [Sphaerisporangium krabiense]GII63739.1 amidohydrolase [Sphaerisporangium krabiense]